MKSFDLSGQRFGRLLVVAPAEAKNGKRLWLCRCDCGNESTPPTSALRSGHSQSCGCASHEASGALLRARNLRHGHSKAGGILTPTYRSWRNMVYRCTSPSDPSYESYGAKGVTVCARWMQPKGQGFLNFLADMGERPAGMTIDRIENANGYEAGNCRWATPTTQQNNRTTSRFIEYAGRRLTLTQWAREVGITPQSLGARIKSGWPLERALSAKQ